MFGHDIFDVGAGVGEFEHPRWSSDDDVAGQPFLVAYGAS